MYYHVLNIFHFMINDHVVKATKFIREQMQNNESFAVSSISVVLFYSLIV
jgi:hypothetical protein